MVLGLEGINITGMMSNVFAALLIMLGIGFIAIILWALYTWSQYKHRVIVREVTGGNPRPIETWAREKEHKDGTVWWHVMANVSPKKFPKPPSRCISVTPKGKKFYECYLTEDGSFIPISDSNISSYSKSEKKFRPFTTQQRSLLINEFEKANEYDKRKSMHDVIAQAVPYVALVMIITVFLVFWGDAVQPSIEMGNTVNQGLEKVNSLVGKLERIEGAGQTIEGTETNQANNTVPEPPN